MILVGASEHDELEHNVANDALVQEFIVGVPVHADCRSHLLCHRVPRLNGGVRPRQPGDRFSCVHVEHDVHLIAFDWLYYWLWAATRVRLTRAQIFNHRVQIAVGVQRELNPECRYTRLSSQDSRISVFAL